MSGHYLTTRSNRSWMLRRPTYGTVKQEQMVRCNMNHMYSIRIRGHLDDDWTDWFAGLQMTHPTAGETQFMGPLDQAALHGVLTRIRDLNLTLIAVTRIGEEADPHDGD